jgi:hypothetical protein
MVQLIVLIIGCLVVMCIYLFGILGPHYCELYERHYKKNCREPKKCVSKIDHFSCLFFGGIRNFFNKSREVIKSKWGRFIVGCRSRIGGFLDAFDNLLSGRFVGHKFSEPIVKATQGCKPLSLPPCSLLRSLLVDRAHSEEYPTRFQGATHNITEFKVRIPVTDEEREYLEQGNYTLILRPITRRPEGFVVGEIDQNSL